jgi:hypothetical protein
MDSSIDMGGYYPGSGSFGGGAPRMDPNHPTIANPFQYLSFGQTFSRTFSIFFDHLDTFLALTMAVMIPFAIVFMTYGLFIISRLMQEVKLWERSDYSGFEPHHLPLVASILVVQGMAYAVMTQVGRGAMCRAVAELYLGHAPQWKSCLSDAWQRRGPLVGSAVLTHVGLLLGFIIPYISLAVAIVGGGDSLWWIITIVLCGVYVVGAGYFYTGTLLVTPALMVEPLPAPGRTVCMEGLRRSWDLATGSRCYIGCTIFGVFFLHELVRRLLHNMFFSGGNSMGSMATEIFFSLVGLAAMVIPMFVFLPLYAMYVVFGDVDIDVVVCVYVYIYLYVCINRYIRCGRWSSWHNKFWCKTLSY